MRPWGEECLSAGGQGLSPLLWPQHHPRRSGSSSWAPGMWEPEGRGPGRGERARRGRRERGGEGRGSDEDPGRLAAAAAEMEAIAERARQRAPRQQAARPSPWQPRPPGRAAPRSSASAAEHLLRAGLLGARGRGRGGSPHPAEEKQMRPTVQ